MATRPIFAIILSMKLSLNWLGDYIEWKGPFDVAQGQGDPQKIADAITAHVAEVDEVEVQGKILENCCVGKVLTVEKHPNADKLSLCDVHTDRGKIRVVCGGTNLREGMRVAFAHVGARVKWHGEEMMTLEKTKIRGETSEGMICAAEELDLVAHFPDAVGHNIIDMGDGDEDVGKSLKDALNVMDVVLHIDNHAITHRADLFSHIGFARECVAIGIAKWKHKPDFKAPAFPKDALPIKCKVDIKKLVPRYCSCTLSFNSVGKTPDWMVKRLEAVGLRSLNLPVDITNYVSVELGMPLHSFDIADLKGDVHFRLAREGEKIVTLDKEERELPEGAIVLSDDEGIFDLMGVMGGLRSSTKESTKNVYLHSAVVDPVSIRNTIIATGHRTDASTVYEKGIPLVSAEQGLFRALELFLDLVPGAKITSKMDSWGDNGKPKPIPLSLDRVHSMLGVEIPAKTVKKILTDLEFTVERGPHFAKATRGKKRKEESFEVTPPLHRIGDITGEHDLIEEIGRIYGFNEIDAVMPAASIEPPERDERLHTIRDALKERDYVELRPVSFVGPDLLRKCGIDPATAPVVENALGEELSLMTPSTLPKLLEHAAVNLPQMDVLRTFHWSQVLEQDKEERRELGMLVANRTTMNLKSEPFLVAKQELLGALSAVGYEVSTKDSDNVPAFAHPGRSADLIIGDKTVGILCELHPSIRSNFDLPERAAVTLVDLSVLFAIEATAKIAEVVPQFPSVAYDMTIPMDHSKSAAELIANMRGKSELLKSVKVVDLYEGKDGTYQLTVRCTYRADDRTLTEEEVKKEHQKVAQ